MRPQSTKYAIDHASCNPAFMTASNEPIYTVVTTWHCLPWLPGFRGSQEIKDMMDVNFSSWWLVVGKYTE